MPRVKSKKKKLKKEAEDGDAEGGFDGLSICADVLCGLMFSTHL